MSVLMSILRNTLRLSASSRRLEEVKLSKLALYTERGRVLRLSLGLKIIYFVCCVKRIVLFVRTVVDVCRCRS